VTAEATQPPEFILHVDPKRPSDVMLVAFAGMADGFAAMPVFEFVKLLSDIDVHKMFLRDPNRHWFQNGAPGIADDVRGVAAHIRSECAKRGVRRVVVVGSSAGGFSALLFGMLLGADEVHSFSPRTRLTEPSDFKVEGRHAALQAAVAHGRGIFDLRDPALLAGSRAKRMWLHYPLGEEIDVRHAKYLEGVPGVTLLAYPFPTHLLAAELNRRRVLKPMILGAVRGSALVVRLCVLQARLQMRGWNNLARFVRTLVRALRSRAAG
jgi:hypothetical protein